MPVPLIVIFVSTPSTPEDGQLIDRFSTQGFLPLIDALHQEQYDWMNRNYHLTPHAFYLFKDNRIFDYTLQDTSPSIFFGPDFVISFQQADTITPENWRDIHAWLNYHICTRDPESKPLTREEQDQLDRTQKFLTLPNTQNLSQPELNLPVLTQEYELDVKLDSEHDICYYQVNKPHTDLPYTTLTRNFSTTGHLPFFTSLFIADSWGVASSDITFLERVWTHLKMPVGEFHMERLYMERVQACFKGAPEPEVYRRTIPRVMETIDAQRKGVQCGHKRKRFVPQELWSKIIKK